MSTKLQDLQTRRAAYAAAELKILQGQEYRVGDGATFRQLKRADLAEVRAEIRRLDQEIALELARAQGQRRVYQLIPR
jgi:hypothetical protein